MSKTIKRLVIESIVYVSLVMTVFTVIIALWWTLEDPHMIKVNNAKGSVGKENGTIFEGVPISPKVVTKGRTVTLHLNYCKLKNIDGIVTARLVGDKFTVRLTWPNDTGKDGCRVVDRVIPIPANSSNDDYYVEFETIYHVNPLKDRDVVIRSERFEVD